MANNTTHKKKGAEEEAQPAGEAQAAKLHLLRGFKDIFPADQPYWDRLRSLAEEFSTAYGFHRMDTPLVEETALFTRAVGDATDIVEKEMFSFKDRGGDLVALRPEGTSGVVRAYVEHGMVNLPQPVKLWYFGPMFRYDRPQAGRLRQFHQWGLESLGEQHPAADAELLAVATGFFRELGIPVVAQVNSIGCAQCRPGYVEELTNYLKAHRTQLSEESRTRLGIAPLRVLDSKAEEDREVIESAPQMVDWLCDSCKQHFIRVLEYLDEFEVSYALAPFLVRGLDYYTKTVFELLPADVFEGGGPISSQAALAAGGRYDALVEQLGGRPTPATGIAFGIERIITKYREAVAAGTAVAPSARTLDVYMAQLGDQAKRKAMRLFDALRKEDFTVAAHFAKDALKAQLEHANRLQAKLTLILGQKEVIDDTIIIREMSSGIQEIVPFKRVRDEVRRRLAQEEVRETVDESLKVAGEGEPSTGERRTTNDVLEEEETEGEDDRGVEVPSEEPDANADEE
ncbi:MAG: histidine--tRNA ligase [bacterium]|nr:histidine--tRNA ligase [bacterium]